MKNPVRITIALDDEANGLIEKMKKEKRMSQSELMRQALRCFYENKDATDASVGKKVDLYKDMLLSGEHVILDVDHWLLFLSLVETSPEKENFWEKHREVARSHAEQMKNNGFSTEYLLERLEACNFFRLTKKFEKRFYFGFKF